MTRLRRLAFYAALGPITGPLVAGALRHWRLRPVLSALYAWAAVLWLAESLPLLARLLAFVKGHA